MLGNIGALSELIPQAHNELPRDPPPGTTPGIPSLDPQFLAEMHTYLIVQTTLRGYLQGIVPGSV